VIRDVEAESPRREVNDGHAAAATERTSNVECKPRGILDEFFGDTRQWSGPPLFAIGAYYVVRTAENPATLIGVLAAAGLTRYIEGLLFGLTPLDAGTFAAVSLLFAAVAMLASYVPARRATKVEPVLALRHE
jgi:hypothetical protein